MNAPVAEVTESHAADRRQAAYFRRVLHERYMDLGDRIASHQRLLIKHRDRDEASEARRVRKILRDEEREREMVQRLVERLDARFPVSDSAVHVARMHAGKAGRPAKRD